MKPPRGSVVDKRASAEYDAPMEDARPLLKRAKFVAFVLAIFAVVSMFVLNRLTHGDVQTDEALAFALTATIGMFFPSQAAVDWKGRSLTRGVSVPKAGAEEKQG